MFQRAFIVLNVLLLALNSQATPVKFTGVDRAGNPLNAGIVITATEEWMKRQAVGTNIVYNPPYSGRIANGSLIVNLVPADYDVQIENTKPWQISVFDTNIVVNAISLTTSNLTRYAYTNVWSGVLQILSGDGIEVTPGGGVGTVRIDYIGTNGVGGALNTNKVLELAESSFAWWSDVVLISGTGPSNAVALINESNQMVSTRPYLDATMFWKTNDAISGNSTNVAYATNAGYAGYATNLLPSQFNTNILEAYDGTSLRFNVTTGGVAYASNFVAGSITLNNGGSNTLRGDNYFPSLTNSPLLAVDATGKLIATNAAPLPDGILTNGHSIPVTLSNTLTVAAGTNNTFGGSNYFPGPVTITGTLTAPWSGSNALQTTLDTKLATNGANAWIGVMRNGTLTVTNAATVGSLTVTTNLVVNGSGTATIAIWQCAPTWVGLGVDSLIATIGQDPIMEIRHRSVNAVSDADGATVALFGKDTFEVNKGAAIVFGASYTGTTIASGGRIAVAKENATDGDYSYYMNFSTRKSGGNLIERMRIDSSGNVSMTTNLTVSGTSISATNATLSVSNLVLSIPAWKDIVFEPSALSHGGTAVTRVPLYPGAIPTVEAWEIDSYADGAGQFNHDLAITNAAFPNLYIVPHIHLSVTNLPAGTSNATFKVDYVWCKIGSNFATTAVSGSLTNTQTFTAVNEHKLMNLGNITNNTAAGSISSLFHYRLTRITSTAGDIGTEDVRLHDFDIHYPVNRFGSSTPSDY